MAFAFIIFIDHSSTFYRVRTRFSNCDACFGCRGRLFHAIKVPFVLRRTRRILIVAMEVNRGWLCQYDLISCARCLRTLVRAVTLKSHVWTRWTATTCYKFIVILLIITPALKGAGQRILSFSKPTSDIPTYLLQEAQLWREAARRSVSLKILLSLKFKVI